ncbi:MAG: PIG-L family deacetylase [Candidatus Bathyarchaeota archaeon]|nr:PIG-L family deacetylase [Candidatus Bathyarchaeota archaeon]
MTRGLLAIVSHPDDETFGCGGTLALHAMAGHEAGVLCLTCSEEVRRQELINATNALGVEEPMIFDEVELSHEADLIRRISEAIVSKRPEVVITHLPFDYHREHRLAHDLVKEAIEWAAHTTTHEEPWAVCRLLLMEVNTLIPTPHVIVDITDAFEKKMEAVGCYASQLAKFPWGYYEDFNKKKAELRGVQGGCLYAEAFVEEPLAGNSPFFESKSTKSLI